MSNDDPVDDEDLKTSEKGSLTLNWTVPSDASLGSHKVEAVGEDDSKADENFMVNSARSAPVDSLTATPTPQPVPTVTPTLLPEPTHSG